VARLGLEDFALILTDLPGPEAVIPVARNIQAAFRPPFRIAGHEFTVGCTMGIATYPGDGEDAAGLVRSAEAALRVSHRDAPNEYRFYSATMNEQDARRLRLEAELRRAVERGEFVVHYQPQIDRAGRKLTGVEALVRWLHPELGLVSPTQFISLLEETGLIVPVGEWVLREACRQTRAWHKEGTPVGRISVNLSARQLRDPGLVATVARILAETGLAAADLELEITEGMIEDAEEAHRICSGLANMGVTLAIDDFGTGYASVARLKRFPISTLKIDETFVRDVASSSEDAALARALIAMAHSLRLRVVAEGVETAEQLAFLDAERCDEFQGFFFGRPQSAGDLSRRLHRTANYN
jgi:EAL domain-containing protein (putative c-di-GMP-specific phosphodiesterase class I)